LHRRWFVWAHEKDQNSVDANPIGQLAMEEYLIRFLAGGISARRGSGHDAAQPFVPDRRRGDRYR
ncbi:MAG: hypothetical protein WBF27_01265, partial [Xanthobacteraceae bacterium]